MTQPIKFSLPEGHLKTLEATLSDSAYEVVSEYTYNVEKDWYTYIERESTFMDWCSVKYVPTNFNHKWYSIGRMRSPVFSRDKTGPDELTVAAFEESTVPMVFASLDFGIPEVTINISRQAGMDVMEATRYAIIRQLERSMAHVLYQGEGKSGVQGMKDKANNSSTYNTVKWGAATGPASCVHDMADKLIVDGFDPPYDLILSSNLASYTLDLIGTTTRDIELDAVRDTIGYEEGGRIWWEDLTPSTTVENYIYPLPAVGANDGYGFLVKSSPTNFNFLIGQDITVEFEPYVRRVGQMKGHLCGTVSVQMGLQCIQTNSICKHDRVDLA
jgi:uncharacterized linocin/CFP29 family protein